MRLLVLLFSLSTWLAFPALAQDEPAKPAAATCEVAEVNPVTGNVLCIKPFGAPVEPPKATEDEPCKPHHHEDAEWTWRPKCKG